MTSVKNRLIRASTNTHVALIRSTHGRLGARIAGLKLCILTTTGRRSGLRRDNPLACFPHGDALIVIASAGGSDRHPAWYWNLVSDPAVHVEVDGVVRPMTARTATDEERAQIWPGVIAEARNFASYQDRTSREIPVVILEPRSA